jgi:hypothetical protein
MIQGPERRQEFFFWTGPGPGGRGLKSKFRIFSYKYCILLVLKECVWGAPNPKKYLRTLGNEVVKSPRSDFFKFCFWTFYSIINTLIKKKKNKKNLVSCQFPGTGLQSENFREKVAFGCGRVNFGPGYLGFCSTFVQHIYSKGFLVSFLMIYLSKLSVF